MHRDPPHALESLRWYTWTLCHSVVTRQAQQFGAKALGLLFLVSDPGSTNYINI